MGFWAWVKSLFTKKEEKAEVIEKPVVPKTPTIGGSVFKMALEYTFINEGGFSNVKEDKGGPTKYGITIHDLQKWRGKTLSADDVRNMTQQEAEKIYEAWYWRPMHLDRITDQNVAIALFDRAVLNGLTGVSRHVRVVCGEAEKGYGDKANFDELIDEVNSMNPVKFVMFLADRCDSKHRATVAADPSQARFLRGWLNRVNRMRKILGDGTTKPVLI